MDCGSDLRRKQFLLHFVLSPSWLQLLLLLLCVYVCESFPPFLVVVAAVVAAAAAAAFVTGRRWLFRSSY